jgi:hypothetical protein
MAKKRKVRTSFRLKTEGEFYDISMLIFNTLKDNILLFSELPVKLGVLGPLPANTLGDLITKFNDARLLPYYNGQTGDVKDFRENLQKAITKNGNWGNTFCDGNIALLQKMGYPLQKEGEGQGKLSETTLTFTEKQEIGKIGFEISLVKGQKIRYGIMYTLSSNEDEDPANWKFFYAGGRTGAIPKLISGEKYKCVSFAMGTHIVLTYSDVKEITVL